jgi:hypothetical protein
LHALMATCYIVLFQYQDDKSQIKEAVKSGKVSSLYKHGPFSYCGN